VETTEKNNKESSMSDEERCLCGQEGCFGHERVPGKIYVPGFTSREERDACKNEIVLFEERLGQHVHDALKAQLVS
jgi:hypothetical protein